jgi:hypothetical protein
VPKFYPEYWPDAIWAVIAAICAVSATILICDVFIFRSVLPASYVSMFGGGGVRERTLIYVALAVGEEVIFRLGAMTAIALALKYFHHGRLTLPLVFVAAGIAQGLNMLRIPMPDEAATFAYDAIRFWSPGLVWGWLYWRHGFVSNVAAHAGTHVILQPMLWLGLHS